MNKTKKAVIGVGAALLALILVVSLMCFLKFSEKPRSYSPQTRADTTQNLQRVGSDGMTPWSLETNLVLSDAVIRGKIASEGQAVMRWGSVFAYEYDVDATEILYGELSAATILLRCFEGMNLPGKNDDVILFVRELPQGCITTNADTGIFAVLPDGTLYAFSSMDFTAEFDGKQPEELYQAVDEIVVSLEGAGEEYLTSIHCQGLERKIFERASIGAQHLQMSEMEAVPTLSDSLTLADDLEQVSTGAESSFEAEDGESEPDGGEEPAE